MATIRSFIPMVAMFAVLGVSGVGTQATQPAPAPLPVPAGCATFDGATPFSYVDTTGTVFYSMFGRCGTVWGAYVIRVAGGKAQLVAMPFVPQARVSLTLQIDGSLALTAWHNKQPYRMRVPGFVGFAPRPAAPAQFVATP